MPNRHWLYRVLENDDVGDPLDFGMVSAASAPEADGRVRRYLLNVIGLDSGTLVRMYEQQRMDGVWESVGGVRTITV